MAQPVKSRLTTRDLKNRSLFWWGALLLWKAVCCSAHGEGEVNISRSHMAAGSWRKPREASSVSTTTSSQDNQPTFKGRKTNPFIKADSLWPSRHLSLIGLLWNQVSYTCHLRKQPGSKLSSLSSAFPGVGCYLVLLLVWCLIYRVFQK